MGEDKVERSLSKKRLSRREFVKLSTASVGWGLLGAVIGAAGTKKLIDNYGEEIFDNIDRLRLSVEARKMLPEIVEFREKLGLKGPPEEVENVLHTKKDWLSKSPDFINDLPSKNQSYGMRIANVMEAVFGDNNTRLVRGARVNPDNPWGMSFDYRDRFCNISDAIHSVPIESEFTGYVLHEAVGHGSDPAMARTIYPPEILIRVEHGKWMALSQALSVEGQFFKHPEDLTYPLLKRKIGEAVGRFFVNGKKGQSITSESQGWALIEKVIVSISKQKEVQPERLKFNKQTCSLIGEAVIDMITKGKLVLAGKLEEEYQSGLEAACREIYAEMIKYALLYPEKIENNHNIISGVSQIFTAISGQDLPIQQRRRQVQSLSQEVIDQNYNEKTFVYDNEEPPTELPSLTTTLTPEKADVIQTEQDEFRSREKDYIGFISDGRLPESLSLTEAEKTTVAAYSSPFIKINRKYPSLLNMTGQQYDTLFDPELHIWEIQEIEQAIDSGFIRNLIVQDKLSQETLDDIIHRSRVLKKFCSSSAF